MNDLMSLSCSLNLFSASSKASSLICDRRRDTRRMRTELSDTKRAILCRRCRRTQTHLRRDPRQVLEVAADAVGLLDDGVHAQLGDLVDERVLVAFPVLHHCGQQGESRSRGANRQKNTKKTKSRGNDQEAAVFFFTQIFPALVLVDVDVDLLDGQQRLRQFGSVVVALRRGSEQLHQQQWVAHDSLHGLDEERAQVDVVCLSPGRNPTGSADRRFRTPGNKLGVKAKQLFPLILLQNTLGFSCSLQKCLGEGGGVISYRL